MAAAITLLVLLAKQRAAAFTRVSNPLARQLACALTDLCLVEAELLQRGAGIRRVSRASRTLAALYVVTLLTDTLSKDKRRGAPVASAVDSADGGRECALSVVGIAVRGRATFDAGDGGR